MKISCLTNIRVVGKSVYTSSNTGKSYFNLAVVSDGHCGEVGCSDQVYKFVEENKEYSAHFDLNTAYLGKNYSCNVFIDSVSEVSSGKK